MLLCCRRINFLVDVIGSNVDDLLQYPQYCLLSLADTIGPRYYVLARQSWLEQYSDPITGTLQLQRVMAPELKSFLGDVAQVGLNWARSEGQQPGCSRLMHHVDSQSLSVSTRCDMRPFTSTVGLLAAYW